MELMCCTWIGTSETELSWVSEKKRYTLNVECTSTSTRVVHMCALKAHWGKEAELQAQGALSPGIQSPVSLNSV